MNLSSLLARWTSLSPEARIVIVTDPAQQPIAEEIRSGSRHPVEILLFTDAKSIRPPLERLLPRDLVMALFSIDTFISAGGNRVFSPFGKPDWLPAKFAFIRLGISSASLREGLSTPREAVYAKIDEMNRLNPSLPVRVTAPAGTDVTLRIRPFTTCSHEITEDGGYAFLPPSETSSEIAEGTANGKIVIDVTIGQLYHFGELLGAFGLTAAPITLAIRDGFITDISGGGMADELREKLFELPPACRKLVELGQGLSDMQPTGLIGVDESILSTCHFGFGDGGECGVHLDLVVSAPTIRSIR